MMATLPTPHLEPAVFLNCPYDADFKPLFDALLFTSVCCGFLPRCALDSGSSGTPRIDRIVTTLQACPYSIHDLSRCRGEGQESLARFNMPLELGMAVMLAKEREGDHEWMALAPEGPRYEQYASDLSGFDLERYDGSVPMVVRKVASWLFTRRAAVAAVITPHDILAVLPEFVRAQDRLVASWLGTPPWVERVRIAQEAIVSDR